MNRMINQKLTPKQKRFVEEYLVDLNATQAAIRAGYSEKTAYSIGSENLSKPEIQTAVAEAQNERSERIKISSDWVLASAVQVYERCMEQGSFNPSGANRALELIGKHVSVQAFYDKNDHPGKMAHEQFEKIDTTEAVERVVALLNRARDRRDEMVVDRELAGYLED